MAFESVNIGFGNILALNRVVAITGPDSAPIKRLVQDGRKKGICIDMTNGRRTRSVLVLDSGHIVLAALSPESITSRLAAVREASVPGKGAEGG